MDVDFLNDYFFKVILATVPGKVYQLTSYFPHSLLDVSLDRPQYVALKDLGFELCGFAINCDKN